MASPLDAVLRGSLLERHTFHPSTVSCATCAGGKGHVQWVPNVNKLRDRKRSEKLRVVEVARASRSKSEQGRGHRNRRVPGDVAENHRRRCTTAEKLQVWQTILYIPQGLSSG